MFLRLVTDLLSLTVSRCNLRIHSLCESSLWSMGLLVSDDGHYQGWLAALLCCCAALDGDDNPAEREKERSRL